MIFDSSLKDEIRKIAYEKIPFESCGLIANISGKLIVYPCVNISSNKNNNSIINPLDYIRVSESGKVIGYFHSHEHNGISMKDTLTAFNHNVYSVIYAWKNDKFYLIKPELGDFLNRDFKFGTNDCFGLVVDYFKYVKNIEITNYSRGTNWSEYYGRDFIEKCNNNGFYEVTTDIKQDDVLVFKYKNNYYHFAIYVDGDFMLHHPRDSKSIISELNDTWKRRLGLVLRYKKNE